MRTCNHGHTGFLPATYASKYEYTNNSPDVVTIGATVNVGGAPVVGRAAQLSVPLDHAKKYLAYKGVLCVDNFQAISILKTTKSSCNKLEILARTDLEYLYRN